MRPSATDSIIACKERSGVRSSREMEPMSGRPVVSAAVCLAVARSSTSAIWSNVCKLCKWSRGLGGLGETSAAVFTDRDLTGSRLQPHECTPVSADERRREDQDGDRAVGVRLPARQYRGV